LQVRGNLVDILQQLVEAHLGEVFGLCVCAERRERRVDRLEVRHVVTLRTGRESAQRTHQQPLRCAPQQPSRGRAGIACSRCHTMWWIVIVS
jgi:hypothetical protein